MTRAIAACGLLLLTAAWAAADEPTVSFCNEILPLLARQGCSAAACHGSPRGKGGLQLSLWGLDPTSDRFNIVERDAGRRIHAADSARSLLLAKPSRAVEHKGGLRLPAGSFAYARLQTWIEQGCPSGAEDPQCVAIELQGDSQRKLPVSAAPQTIGVAAVFADGSRRDIADLAVFTSSDEDVLSVTSDGVITPWSRGLAAINVRFQKHLQTVFVTVTDEAPSFSWDAPKPVNYVDQLVYAQLRELQILPAPRCTDDEFIRRIHLDLTGVLPEVEQVRAFLADRSSDKRTRLIDELLERPEHAKYFAQRWGDLLQITRAQMGKDSALAYARWLEEGWANNIAYDQFARQLISAEGDTSREPLANFYRMGSDHSETMEAVAVIFLGARIGCAKCHNHPHEKWTQHDYHGMRHFFARIAVEPKGESARVSLEPATPVKFPDSDKVVSAWLPGAGTVDLGDEEDPRAYFASWLTAPDNPQFARVEVNRLWSYLLGAGIVEPFDDLRETNPPINPSLLEALATDFVKHGYDRRHILRTILVSNTYQASLRAPPSQKQQLRPAAVDPETSHAVVGLLKKHCLDCHGATDPEAGLNFETLSADFRDPSSLEVWKKIFDQVSQGAMPPPDDSQLTADERSQITRWIRGERIKQPTPVQDDKFFARARPRRLSAEQLLDAICRLTGVGERFRDVAADTHATHLPLPDLQDHEFLQTFGQSQRSSTCSCDRPSDSNLSEALLMYNGQHVHDKLKDGNNRFRRAIRDKKSNAEIIDELFLSAFCRPPRAEELAAAEKYIAANDNRDRAFEDLCWSLMTTSEFLTQH